MVTRMSQVPTFRALTQPKRTRVLSTKQSKGGCSTCKARRVKCDETKPTCERCQRADRICEYGSKRAISTVSSISSSSSDQILSRNPVNLTDYEGLATFNPSPVYALSDAIWQPREQSRLANLGVWVLRNDPLIDTVGGTNSPLWLSLLPQLVHSTRTASSAAAAFGAVYEACLLSDERSIPEAQASMMYSKALSVLQEDLVDRSFGTAPLLLSCILLACVEVVQRRRGNALKHLEGAFQVLEISEDDSLLKTPDATPTQSPDSSSREMPQTDQSTSQLLKKDDLLLMLRSLDLHTSTYILSRPPHLPAAIIDDAKLEFKSISDADMQLVITLHSLHHFTNTASRLKYLPPVRVPRELTIEQGRHIARLMLWLKCFDDNILHLNHDLSPSAYHYALMLRAQCLVAVIYASTILCPYETGYDRYSSSFQQIVDAATIVVDAKDASTVKFRPGLGIIQPLLFTVLKYRDGVWRRKAIALLRRAGIEGPWVGKVEAAVAQRAMDVEEEMVEETLDTSVTPDMIPERKRLAGMHLVHDHYEFGTKTDKVRVLLTRCVDIEYMISGKEFCESPKHWNIWQEIIDM